MLVKVADRGGGTRPAVARRLPQRQASPRGANQSCGVVARGAANPQLILQKIRVSLETPKRATFRLALSSGQTHLREIASAGTPSPRRAPRRFVLRRREQPTAYDDGLPRRRPD
jgi:hypothetical protein